MVEVAGGRFLQCYQLVDILYSASSGFTTKGYDDTPNNGHVYKVWVSKDPSFPSPESKTDNFKVGVQEPPLGGICVKKFYDANGNGIWDDGEQELIGWKVEVSDDQGHLIATLYTDECLELDPGTYTVEEVDERLSAGWKNTTDNPVEVEVLPGSITDVVFGNI